MNVGDGAAGSLKAAWLEAGAARSHSLASVSVARQLRLTGLTAATWMVVPMTPLSGVPEAPLTMEIAATVGVNSPHGSTVTVTTAGCDERPVSSVLTTPSS